jgi:hypothetical protein
MEISLGVKMTRPNARSNHSGPTWRRLPKSVGPYCRSVGHWEPGPNPSMNVAREAAQKFPEIRANGYRSLLPKRAGLSPLRLAASSRLGETANRRAAAGRRADRPPPLLVTSPILGFVAGAPPSTNWDPSPLLLMDRWPIDSLGCWEHFVFVLVRLVDLLGIVVSTISGRNRLLVPGGGGIAEEVFLGFFGGGPLCCAMLASIRSASHPRRRRHWGGSLPRGHLRQRRGLHRRARLRPPPQLLLPPPPGAAPPPHRPQARRLLLRYTPTKSRALFCSPPDLLADWFGWWVPDATWDWGFMIWWFVRNQTCKSRGRPRFGSSRRPSRMCSSPSMMTPTGPSLGTSPHFQTTILSRDVESSL